MPTNKLPVLGGGERELQDGDRVRLRCGIEDTVSLDQDQLKRGGIWCWDGLSGYCWNTSGSYCEGRDNPLDIVLILGPAEETHGDLVTKLCTLPVTMKAETWDTHEPVGIGKQDDADAWLCKFGIARTHHNEDGLGFLVLRDKTKKPTPSPTYTERLIEAVRKGEVVLPPKGSCVTGLYYLENEGKWLWMGNRISTGPRCSFGDYKPDINGPLPPWQPGMEKVVDLATVREAAEVGK